VGANLGFQIRRPNLRGRRAGACGHWISFKCSSDDFAELVGMKAWFRQPYLAPRAQWVALETEDAVPDARV